MPTVLVKPQPSEAFVRLVQQISRVTALPRDIALKIIKALGVIPRSFGVPLGRMARRTRAVFLGQRGLTYNIRRWMQHQRYVPDYEPHPHWAELRTVVEFDRNGAPIFDREALEFYPGTGGPVRWGYFQ
jgi:hypothetical protein